MGDPRPAGASKVVLEAEDINRAIRRMAHEIIERNKGSLDIALVGIRKRGVPLAHRMAAEIEAIEGSMVPTGDLDVSFYRDDIGIRRPQEIFSTNVKFDLNNRTVVLVDDVLYTGRTVRAAIDAVVDFGRPRYIQLAVLVDRGHRELPIRADFIGKNLPTAPGQEVNVHLHETDGEDAVIVVTP